LQETGLHRSDDIKQLVNILIIEGVVKGKGYPIEKGDDIIILLKFEGDLEACQEPVGVML
jgi:hypothetical protein